jgi:hypothetical protein
MPTNSPTWDQIIDATVRVGFPIVAYLLLFLGLGGTILGAVRFFTVKLDQDRSAMTIALRELGTQIVAGQDRIIDAQAEFNRTMIEQNRTMHEALRELTKTTEATAEGMRMTMVFLSRTQTEVEATKRTMEAARSELAEMKGTVQGNA